MAEDKAPFDAAAEQALRQAAEIAALHIVRNRTGEDMDRRLRGEQVRNIIEGRGPLDLLPLGSVSNRARPMSSSPSICRPITTRRCCCSANGCSLCELTGLDLDDPDQRLAAELQLRLQ